MIILTVAGRVTKNAVLRHTTNSTVLGFSVAVDVGFGDKKHPVFVNCSLWGKRGEALEAYIKKGLAVTVSGNGDLREWEANGKSGTSLELNVSEIDLQGSKNSQDDQPRQDQTPSQPPPANEDPGFSDDEIPF